MKKFLFGLLAGLLLMASPALASGGGGSQVYSNWFTVGTPTTSTITGSSTAHAFPISTGQTARICNQGTTDVYINAQGTTSGVTATTSSSWIQAGTCQAFNLKPFDVQYTYWAGITSGASTTVYVETGLGTPISRAAPSGGGGGGCSGTCVTSIGISAPAEINVAGSPVTSSGIIALTWNAQTKNFVLAGPTSGSNATPTFRALVGADLPVPGASSLGGVDSLSRAAHTFLTAINTDGTVSQAAIVGSDLPNPSATTLGGIQSAAAVSHQWIASISTSGVPALSQPAFTDISGTLAATQCPAPSSSTVGCVRSSAVVTHNFMTGYSTAGVPSIAQPAFTDISGLLTTAQLPTLNSANIFVGNSSNVATGVAMSGDCSLANTGAITCTLTNGVAFANIATSGSANDLIAGVVSSSRGGAGAVSGILKANGTGTVSQAVPNTDYAPAGQVAISGTGATVTAAQWAAYTSFVVTASSQTLTIPATSTLNNGGGISVAANGGAVTVQANAADNINGGSSGGTVSCASGLTCFFWTDGSGHIYANPLTAGAGSGTVTSAALTMPGIFSVSGSPITTSGTFAVTASGTSGGIPYFNSATTLASSAALTANLPVFGGGAGVAPISGTRTGNTTTVATGTGTYTNGDGVKIDANGNLVDAGGAYAAGTITSLTCGTGLSGGTITTTGTCSFAAIAADNVLGNASGSSAAPGAVALVSCSGASNALTYNTTTHAFGCNTVSGSGTVTSVGLSMPGIFTVTGSPVTGSGTLTATANGTSGGLPYFSSATTLSSSGAYTTGQILVGGGTGAAPTSSANASLSTGALTLGASGTVGSVTMGNATSGTVTLDTVTGALGSVNAHFPANTGTVDELNLAATYTAAKTFTNSDLLLLGSSTGATTFTSDNAGASNFTLHFPAANDTLVDLAGTQTLTGKTYDTAGSGNVFKINGTTITAIKGNTATVATVSGAVTTSDCVQWDASGNLVDSGAACSGGSTAHPGFASGNYYGGPLFNGVTASRTITSNTLYAIPFPVPSTTTFTKMSIDVTTNAASSACELGVYNNSNGQPSSLVQDVGNVATTTNGSQELTGKTITLNAGWYWLVVGCNNSSLSLEGGNTGSSNFYMGSTSQTSSAVEMTAAWTYSVGGLPGTFPTPSYTTSTSSPLMYMRL